MLDINALTKDRVLLFDGAMGTMLQTCGLPPGDLPELLNLTHPDIVTGIHRKYVNAGADVVTANTFQAHELKLGDDVEAAVSAGIRCARESGAKFVALDAGPLGHLMGPMGTISFERAYEIYRRQMIAGEKAGADLVIAETLSDLYEARAAILAAKENTSLPVICSMTFQENGRTFVGCDPVTAVLTLQGLGADAIGVNCSVGPASLKPVVEAMLKYSRVPVIVQANAGMPKMRDGKMFYDVTPAEYTESVMDMVRLGARIVGGCCGTTPAYIGMLKEKTGGVRPVETKPLRVTACTSGTRTVVLDGADAEICESLNPVKNPDMQQALRDGDMDFLTDEAIEQAQEGSHVLDVSAAIVGIDESETLVKIICAVQGVTGVPLRISSADPGAIEAGLRIYNGIPIINLINREKEALDRTLKLAKKYGALVAGMAPDETGGPGSEEERLEFARKVRDMAISAGIPEENLLIG